MASPRYWPCLEFELDAVACRGLEHFFGGIVEVVVLDAVRGGGGKGEKVSAGLDISGLEFRSGELTLP